jgi:hypothetical protein
MLPMHKNWHHAPVFFVRQRGIKYQCGRYLSPIAETYISKDCERAEALVINELKPYKIQRYCQRGRVHKEYFKVKGMRIIRAVDRWTNFLRQLPYNSLGYLKTM